MKARRVALAIFLLSATFAHAAPPPPPPTELVAAIAASLRNNPSCRTVKDLRHDPICTNPRFSVDALCLGPTSAQATINALWTITDSGDVWLRKDATGWKVIEGPYTEDPDDARLARLGIKMDTHVCRSYLQATAPRAIDGRYENAATGVAFDVQQLPSGRVRLAPLHDGADTTAMPCTDTLLRWSMAARVSAWYGRQASDAPMCSVWLEFMPNLVTIKQIAGPCVPGVATLAGEYRRTATQYRGPAACERHD